jgi:hypothetical protein
LGAFLRVLYLVGASIYAGLNSSAVERKFARDGFRLTNYSPEYHSMSLAPIEPDDFDETALDRLLARAREVTVGEGRLYLDLDNCPRLTKIDALAAVSAQLCSLSMNNCKNLANLDGLRNHRHLTYLKLNGCEKLQNVDAVSGAPNLESVELNRCVALLNVNGLAKHTQLRHLRLRGCTSLLSIDGLRNVLVQQLDLSGCRALKSIDPLKACGQLEELNLSNCVELTNINALAGLPNLYRLNISGCPKLTDLSALAHIKKLWWLSMADNPQLTDLKALPKSRPNNWRGFDGIITFDAQRCPRLTNIETLRQCQSVIELDLTGCPIAPADLAILRQALPESHVRFRGGP